VRFLSRRVLIAAAVVGGLLAVALWPRAAPVEVGPVTRGPLIVTVDEEGVTRVRDRFVVSSPLAGRIVRIELEPGDTVTRGQAVARVRPQGPPLLDARTRAEAQAEIERARAALGRARAEEQRMRATQDLAERELKRARELAEEQLLASQELEAREADARVAAESVNAAAYAVKAAGSELERALARLSSPGSDSGDRVVIVNAPVDGVVLRRLRESEAVVPAGEPLLEIGDPHRIEIVSDLLSSDAVQVKPGARAIIEQWGGDQTLAARVRRIEPAGFTKISALGVEEQRVNVLLDFVDPAAAWGALGDAYRVEVRIVIWEASSVLKVPTSALFRQGTQWAVYRVEDGRARRTLVELGRQTGPEAEVIKGLSEGDRVIVHPADTLEDGGKVVEEIGK
jgi:HlyD family secretion protein